ncbi:MAG: endoribonuclease MazF [Candidatus Lokiarchaeota archaeon]|nr:endoribonuclease MazF [Candidatus Lokiarchaeota archaeon]
MSYVPERGHVVWLEFSLQRGHEQAGRRPAIVISPSTYNERVGLMLACPITSQAKGYPFEVIIPAGLRIAGVVLSDQIKSLDWLERRVEFILTLPKKTVDEVLQKLTTLLR